MQSTLYRDFSIWQSPIPEKVGLASQHSAVSRALAVLMFEGANGRVLGRCPIPDDEFGNEKWYAKRLADDDILFPDFAERPYNVLRATDVQILDTWVFHERRTQPKVTMADIRTKLPKPDWEQARMRSKNFASTAKKGVQGFVATSKPHVIEVAHSAAKGTQQFVEAAIPIAISAVKVTAKLAVVIASVVLPMMGMMALAALTAAASVDPVLCIIVPSDDGGDPTWIEIARWDEA